MLSAGFAPTATARSPGSASGRTFRGADDGPLIIARRGSFAAGGTVLTSPGTFDPTITGGPGQTLHGDHVYCQFEVPMRPRTLPLVMWHGSGQMGKTWESTTDGREGIPIDIPASRLCRLHLRSAAQGTPRHYDPRHYHHPDTRGSGPVRRVAAWDLAKFLSRQQIPAGLGGGISHLLT